MRLQSYNAIQEVRFLLYLTAAILGFQLAIYFFYRYYYIRDESLQLNKILLSYGFFFMLTIIGILIFGGNWNDMILDAESFMKQDLSTYGYSLFVVYLVWIGLILVLYPFCEKYMMYKTNNKNKWWLSYL